MRWYLRHWYNVGLAVAIIVLAIGVVVDLTLIQKILLLNFAVLLLHEFEEYQWPGGGALFLNQVMRHSDIPDRYPLNQVNSMVVNVVACYPFYALPIFFPHLVWLALAPILFSLLECAAHVIGGTIVGKGHYTPGAITGLLWLGICVWYLVEIHQVEQVTAADWWIAVGYVVVWVAVFLGLITYKLLATRSSRYPFAPEELAGFDKYRHIFHQTIHPH